jgi:uncharacterized protein YndB with AHSA1/START domain
MDLLIFPRTLTPNSTMAKLKTSPGKGPVKKASRKASTQKTKKKPAVARKQAKGGKGAAKKKAVAKQSSAKQPAVKQASRKVVRRAQTKKTPKAKAPKKTAPKKTAKRATAPAKATGKKQKRATAPKKHVKKALPKNAPAKRAAVKQVGKKVAAPKAAAKKHPTEKRPLPAKAVAASAPKPAQKAKSAPAPMVRSAPFLPSSPEKPATAALKQRYQMEFYLNATPASLFDLISSPSGFSEWFCDDVNVVEGKYIFKWGDETGKAECLIQRPGESIRFRWEDDAKEDPGAFFEFRIRVDSMTNEICLVVTDHAWPRDLEEEQALWTAQIQKLTRVLGA